MSSLLIVKPVNMTGTDVHFSNGKMKRFYGFEFCNCYPGWGKTMDPVVALIFWYYRRNFSGWKLCISVCGAMRTEKKPSLEIWKIVLDPATVATVTVWLMAVWFEFRAVPCLCVCVCERFMCLYEPEQKCTYVNILKLCDGGMKKENKCEGFPLHRISDHMTPWLLLEPLFVRLCLSHINDSHT